MSSSDETTEETAVAQDETATESAEAQPEPEEVREPDPLRDAVLDELTSIMGDAIVGTHVVPGRDMWVRVKPEAWAETANTVRLVLGARFFSFLSAIDWLPSPFGRQLDADVDNRLAGNPPQPPTPPAGGWETGYTGGETRFQVFARVTNLKDHWGLTLKADVGDENPSIETWTKVYSGADWHEREAWEMFGIEFVGHPGLRRLYLPADFEGTPLRKDFPLLSRLVKPWPGIVDVEPMPGEDSEPAEEATA